MDCSSVRRSAMQKENSSHIIGVPRTCSSEHNQPGDKRHLLLFVQVSCASLAVEGAAGGRRDAWAACLDPEYGLSRRMQSKHCRVYSFGCVQQPHKPIGDVSSVLHLQGSTTFLLFIWSQNPLAPVNWCIKSCWPGLGAVWPSLSQA